MSKIKSIVKNVSVAAAAAVVMSGCSALQEGLASQMEIPTLENQANRVAIGMTIVRENNIMAFKMPISADAKWPAIVTADLTEDDYKFIDEALMDGPYFSTIQYSKPIQRKMLGSGALVSLAGGYGNIAAQMLDSAISPLTYRAIKKLRIFYGDDKANWPDVFDYDSSAASFLDFSKTELKEIDSPTGDVYDTIGAAVISLAPTNLQKDLEVARTDMLDAFLAVTDDKKRKGDLETDLKKDTAKSTTSDYQPLSAQEKLDIQNELSTIEEKIKADELAADEKEKIYFELLDGAAVAIEGDINLEDENYVKLAKNINMVSTEIQSSSTEAYTAFGLAAANIAANNIVLKFPKELQSLAATKAHLPVNLQSKFDIRVKRLVKNAVYLLPNIFIGTYYANKQSNLAEKYESVTEKIVLAYEVKQEQEAAAAEDAAAAEKEAQEAK